MAQRIYLVTGPDLNKHLVRASVPSQAIAVVAQSQFSVSIATQNDLVDLVQQGVTVQSVPVRE